MGFAAIDLSRKRLDSKNCFVSGGVSALVTMPGSEHAWTQCLAFQEHKLTEFPKPYIHKQWASLRLELE